MRPCRIWKLYLGLWGNYLKRISRIMKIKYPLSSKFRVHLSLLGGPKLRVPFPFRDTINIPNLPIVNTKKVYSRPLIGSIRGFLYKKKKRKSNRDSLIWDVGSNSNGYSLVVNKTFNICLNIHKNIATINRFRSMHSKLERSFRARPRRRRNVRT